MASSPPSCRSDRTQHPGRRSRHFTPRPHYISWLNNILTLDRSDYLLRKLHSKLTRCLVYQQAVPGSGDVWGYDPCDCPECFYCHRGWKKKEASKFSPGRLDVVHVMDALHVERAAGRLAGAIPDFTCSHFFTVSLFACPLDALPDEIVAAGAQCREIVHAMVDRASALLGVDVALFGHVECSSPKWTSEIERYLFTEQHFGQRDLRGQQWTVLHWHGFVVAPLSVDVVRGAFVATFDDVVPAPRRVC